MLISLKTLYPFATILAVAVILATTITSCTKTGTADPENDPKSLPVDFSAFAVTGEEIDPVMVSFSNGDKTVAFIPMIHMAKPGFYKAVAEKVTEQKESGATLYYEFVDFDVLDDKQKRKVRAMVGILPTPDMYDQLSDDGYVGQSIEDFLGLVNDKDVNIDVTAEELIETYEEKFGPIEVTGPDATSDLGEMATTILPQENVSEIIFDARNEKIAVAIIDGPDSKIVLLFGAQHGPGIFAGLKARDPRWRRIK